MRTEKQIEVQNLGCIRQKRSLFSGLSFLLTAGELLLIRGPNGSGKSSLLRLLTGLVTPSSGEIYWKNKSIYEWRNHYWDELHYIGHSNGIKLGLTVLENLELSNYFSASVYSLQQAESDAILSYFQLSQLKNTPAKFLSAGEKRRLALARLLWVPKTIWILDEPTTALDKTIETLFLDCLTTHLQKGGIAIISSHHDMLLKEASIKPLRLGA